MTRPPFRDTFQRLPKWLIGSTALLFTALVAWADLVVFNLRIGGGMSLWVVFVLPVLLAAYAVNLQTAVFVAFLAAISSLLETPVEQDWISGGTLWDAFCRFVVLTVIAALAHRGNRALERIERLRRTDSLTGLLNSRGFLERAEAEQNRCSRAGEPLTIAFIDCDSFKTVNDTLGHLIGDEVLKTIAMTVRSRIRSYDLAGRWGGDEFVLLLPETSAETARIVVERVHEALQSVMNENHWPVTFSIGVVTFSPSPPSPLPEGEGGGVRVGEMLRAADQLMLNVKRSTKRAVAYKTVNATQPAKTEIMQ